MSRAHQELLKRICHNRDTLERAKAVLHTASIKTAQGSGYELGQGSSGLPAICAYLAAEELGDNDVTEQIAQAASCLKPRVFKTALNAVKGALSASTAASSPSKSSRNVTYLALLTEKKIGRKGMVQEWMQDVERTLMANRETRRKFGAAYDAITVAVFCWTGQVMGLKANKLGAEILLDNYAVSRDLFDEIIQALDELCQDAARQVQSAIAALKAGASPAKSKAITSPSKTATVSPSKTATLSPPKTSKASPTKPKLPAPTLPPALVPPTPSRAAALTRSPSKSALRAPSADLSPRKTPSHKRKVAFDGPLAEEDEDAFDALATPSKRQKFSSPIKELQLTPARTAGTPRKSSRLAQSATHAEEQEDALQDGSSVASSSRETLDLLRRAASSTASVPSTPRRARTGTVSQPSSAHSTRSARSQPRTPTRRKPALATVAEEHMPRRRYRPAFADTQQWLKGDVRLERTLKPWAERWRELVGSCGGDVWAAARIAGGAR
ncbi:hypothetical protein C8Q79DRAFT_1087085 [Trametes meyenii]|nr:hypothetical protein C8Q79DRAFT_1087085 [Trametes meyenii]